jgi:hypothetical protein
MGAGYWEALNMKHGTWNQEPETRNQESDTIFFLKKRKVFKEAFG